MRAADKLRAASGATAEVYTSIAGGTTASPYLVVYQWNSSSGFGTKYADPSPLPSPTGGFVGGIAFSPDGAALAYANPIFRAPSYIGAYHWSSSGFGAAYTSVSFTRMPGKIAFNPDGSALAFCYQHPTNNTSPHLGAYMWDSSSGFISDLYTPDSVNGTAIDVAFHPHGWAIAAAISTSSPSIYVASWSSSGFGTKYADPTILPTGSGYSIAFHPSGTAIAITHFGSPYVSVYEFGPGGFGAKYADLTTLVAATGVNFTRNGDIILTYGSSPYVAAYQWGSSGFGTKYPDLVPPAGATSLSRPTNSPDGAAIAFTGNVSPYLFAYPWSSSGFGTRYADPTTPPTSAVTDISFAS